MKIIICLILICLVFVNVFAQKNTPCKTNIGDNCNAIISYKEAGDSLSFTFVNQLKDTLYLLTSYIKPNVISSMYLHRIDNKNKIYKIVFTPIKDCLTRHYSDRLNNSEEKIIETGQFIYEFQNICPLDTFVLNIKYKDLFMNLFKENNSIIDFPINEMPKKILKTTANKLKGKFRIIFYFAIFNNNVMKIKLNQEIYYLINDFQIIPCEVKIQNYSFHLF